MLVGLLSRKNSTFDSFSRPENQFQKQRFAIGGNTGGGKDDLAMPLQFGLYFANDERYGVRF